MSRSANNTHAVNRFKNLWHQNFVRRARGYDAAMIQKVHGIAIGQSAVEIMQHRYRVGFQLFELLKDFQLVVDIKVVGGFIEKQMLRVLHKRARNHDTLALATGQLRHRPRGLIRHADALESIHDGPLIVVLVR